VPGPAIPSLSFLLPGNFPDDDPHAGLEDTLQLGYFRATVITFVLHLG
jgi:hypothetical protein